MDALSRAEWSAISHRAQAFNNPLGSRMLDMIDAARMGACKRVFDIGCGKGGLAEAVARRADGCAVVGVDSDAICVAEGVDRLAADSFGVGARIKLDARPYSGPAAPEFDLVACIGSEAALGIEALDRASVVSAAEQLFAWTTASGAVLFAALGLEAPRPAEGEHTALFEMFGLKSWDELLTGEEMRAALADRFTVVDWCSATPAEWRAFEEDAFLAFKAYAEAHMDREGVPERLANHGKWNEVRKETADYGVLGFHAFPLTRASE